MLYYSVKLKGSARRVQKNGRISLFLQVIINRQKKDVPLDLSWPADLVDHKNGRILPAGKDDPDISDYQMMINTAIGKVNEIFKTYRLDDRVLTIDLFVKEYQNQENRKDFLVFMEKEIDKRYHEKNIKYLTYKNHRATLHKLQDFKTPILYYEVNSELLSNFSRYLLTVKKNDPNTIWGNIKSFKTYLKRARLKGITIDQEYLTHPTGMTTNRLVYLEDAELKALYKLYLEEELEPFEKQSLRAFLFQAFTGLRISDVFRASWGWMTNNNELHFVPYKTERFKKSITVPLSAVAASLIETKRGLFFNLPAEQVINRHLKVLAGRCNIHKNLTTHVGRHTFGTLFYRHTKDLLTLSKIMGHSKIQDTMIYAHINDMDKRIGIDLYEEAFLKLKKPA